MTPQAVAAPIFNSFAEVEANSGSDQGSGGQTAAASFLDGTASAFAFPGAFLLTVNAGQQTNGSASADVTLNDLIFSKLPGFESNPNTFAGTFRATQESDASFGDMSANAALSFSGGSGGGSDSTFIPGQDLSFTVNSLQIGVAYSLTFGGSVRTVTGSPRDAFLSLVLGGSPVFDLPEGYTLNSVDGQIVDNLYLGRVRPGSTPVPVPGVLSLLLAGLAGIGFACRRRAARDSPGVETSGGTSVPPFS